MNYNLYFLINNKEPEFQGNFKTIEEAERYIQLLIDAKSRIKSWYIRKSVRGKVITYDYGAHNAFYKIEEVKE